jgi:predicted transcriptional regulator
MSKSQPFAKAILEQIFANNTARVLDHLVTMMPFDYKFNELMDILEIEAPKLRKILIHLSKYGLIEETERGTIKLANNKKTLAIKTCLFDIACVNMDEIIAKQRTKKGKRSV